MKKGRHRRFEEARALKRNTDVDLDKVLHDEPLGRSPEPCDECGAAPNTTHAAWCMAEEDDDPYSELAGDED